MNIPAGQAWLPKRARAWAESFDAFAAAGRAAAAAATRADLLSGIATALRGYFADWDIVDLSLRGQASRSVASGSGEAGLAAALEHLPPSCSPPIASAMRRRTPVVQPLVTDQAELGVLPDGRGVVAALGAGSYAVGPIVSGRRALGAITIIRDEGRAPVSFLELAVLAHVGELTEGALKRMGTRQRARPGRAGQRGAGR